MEKSIDTFEHAVQYRGEYQQDTAGYCADGGQHPIEIQWRLSIVVVFKQHSAQGKADGQRQEI